MNDPFVPTVRCWRPSSLATRRVPILPRRKQDSVHSELREQQGRTQLKHVWWLFSGAKGGFQVWRDASAALACSFQRSEFTPITMSQSCSGISARPEATAISGNRELASGGKR